MGGGGASAGVTCDSTHNVLYTYTSANNGVYACATPNTTPAWSYTGGVSSTGIYCLVCDSTRAVLYTGTAFAVWEYGSSVVTPPPIVSSVRPKRGLVGTTVSITNLAGTNFQTGTTVKLQKSGQGDIKATGVTVVSSTQITCYFNLTGAAIGAWDVVVTNPTAQEGRLYGGFYVYSPTAPTVSSISPSFGVSGLSVSVTLTGTGFQAGAGVRLDGTSGGVNATSVNVVSDKQITCQLTLTQKPPIGIALDLPLGKYDVVVKNPDGQEGWLEQGFSVTNICGQGAGTIVVGFGLMMGLLSIGGTGLLRRRRGSKSR
jgi:hypothetical protein